MAISLHAARLLFLSWLASKTEGMVCWMGQELDPNAPHIYRWVIPVEDPCKCIEVRPGGFTNSTPNRHFKVIYFDIFLISNSPIEIRKWLHCPSDGQGGISIKDTLHQAPSTDTMSTTVAPREPIDASTTDATTTAIPFTCVGKSNGNYADTTDCSKYYVCSNTVKFHLTCAKGT